MRKLFILPILLLLYSGSEVDCLKGVYYELIPDPQKHWLPRYGIDLSRVLEQIESWPKRFASRVKLQSFGQSEGYPLYRVNIRAANGRPFKRRVLIVAGAHGNESVGTGTSVEFVEQLLKNSELYPDYEFVVVPAVNPGSLSENLRLMKNRKNFNRTFQAGEETELTQLFRSEFDREKGRFDLALDMHEAYNRPGFFIIKNTEDDGGLAQKVLNDGINPDHIFTAKEYPFEVANLKNPKKTSYILHAPGETVSTNRGTLKGYFFHDLEIKHSYTVEATGQVKPVEVRQQTYLDLLHSFMRNLP